MKMTVTVYVWLPQSTQVGHASMRLGNGTYISLWPGENKTGIKKKKVEKRKKRQPNERSESLEEDIENEGRYYDQHFDFEKLDESATQIWWDEFITRWNLLGQNCCKTVIDGLRAGGSERLVYGLIYLYVLTLLWTPSEVVKYCSLLREGESNAKDDNGLSLPQMFYSN